MDTNFQMLRKLANFYPKETGIISKTEADHIRSTLCLNEINLLSLRNLRDFVVLYMSHISKNDDAEVQYKNMDKRSAIIAVIDDMIWKMGGMI